MKETNTGFGKHKNMPIEDGIENGSNEMIYQSVDTLKESDASTNEVVNEQDLRKEYGSTGAYEEYTATREEVRKELRKDVLRAEEKKQQSVANMNVEGMPWFHEEPSEQEMQQRYAQPELTGRETRRLIMSSLLAALAIGSVFIGVIFLFLLFATKVWF